MTIMRVNLVGTRLSTEAKAELSDRLIGSFADVEVGRDSPEIRAGFLVIYDELEADDVWMGTQRMTDASPVGRAAIVSTHVMAGPWSDEMKAELFSRIETAVREVADMPRAPGGADFWMTVVEIPGGSWGLGGHPVAIEKLAPVFSPDRQQRISGYLRDRRTP